MRCIALINQKGGVGKTTTAVNLGAALAREGKRVVVVDLDPQANLSLHLGIELGEGEPSVYQVLVGDAGIADALRPTSTDGLRVLPSHIDLSGAELELATALGRETLLRDKLQDWIEAETQAHGQGPADYVLLDCPPSLGLLAINGLAAASEVFIAVQTEFFALQGMSRLVEVVQLIQRRMNPDLAITGIVPCLYDSRLRLAREVLGEIRKYFPDQVFRQAVRANVKLAEAPSFGLSIFDYAPESIGAKDYRALALEVLAQAESDEADSEGLEEVEVEPPAKSNGSPAAPKGEKTSPPINPVTIRAAQREEPAPDGLPELPAEAMTVDPPSDGGA